MAFRATHKTTAKSTKAKKTDDTKVTVTEPVKTKVTEQPLSVEDLVGSPLRGAPSQPTQKDSKDTPQTAAPPPEGTREAPRYSRPPVGRPYRAHTGFSRFGPPRGGFGPYQNYRHPFQQGSRFGQRPGYDTSSPRMGQTGGYHREWGNGESTPPHTQDIDVPTETVRGILDIMPEGHGFLRPKFTPSDRDVYISQSQIRRFMLRNGDMVEGQARQPKDNERYFGLLKVEKVNEEPAEGVGTRPRFEDLVPVYPNKHLRLETGQMPLSTRMIDLIAPIGFGQRGMIVSPPKAGKTTILKEIAAGISANYPNVHLMAALIGERPEEVTDLTRSIKGEVLASNFDESPPDQTRIAEVALDRAKRLVEMGKDVVVLLDSITRLARAYNLVVNPSGRTLSGGFDPAALYPAKKFLGAARCVEPVQKPIDLSTNPGEKIIKEEDGSVKAEFKDGQVGTLTSMSVTGGGSLTVIGTALVDTGSRMDDLIYEEFKGTGNMELTLSRELEERRIFPAIDVGKSGTRHDELLLGEEAMKKITTLRHMLSLLGDEERTMMLVERLGKTKNNNEFLESLSQG